MASSNEGHTSFTNVTASDDLTELPRTDEKPFLKGTNLRTASEEATNFITRVAFEMNGNSALYKVYEQIEQMMKSEHYFKEIKEEMTEEFGDLPNIVSDRKSDVENELCTIVITGETSAGKSTLINLLLGIEILPQSPLTCTSPICRIINDEHKRIILFDKEDRKESRLVSVSGDASEMRKILKECVCATEAGEKYKCVDICWPIPCLQKKIMIVDTPGIGPDDDGLTQRLFDYLPSALACVYVINPTNAGGIQSDRLQRILDEQHRRLCNGIKSIFDPRRAIFVCNKWDQMHEDEAKVFDHIKQKLAEKLINFDSKKLYKISARNELQKSKEGCPVSDDFKSLLEGIEEMIPACLQEKLSRHANWQKYFLDRLDFKLKARLTNALRNEDEKREMARTVVKRTNKVRQKLPLVKEKLKNKANKRCMKVSEKLNTHLHKDETRGRMFHWSENELPKGDVLLIDQKIEPIVEYQIKREIQSWLQERNNCDLSEYMTNKFQNECAVVENDCIEIDNLILGRSLYPEDYNLGLRTVTPDKFDSFIQILPKSIGLKLILISALIPLSPFLILAGILVGPAFIGNKWNEIRQLRQKVHCYKKDKNKYANELANKMLDNVSNVTLNENVFQHYLKEIYEQIDIFCEDTVRKRINTGEILAKRIETDRRQPIDIRKQCFQLESSSKVIYGRMLYTFIIFFGMFIVKPQEIRRTEGSKKIKILVCGRWKSAAVKNFKWSEKKPLDCVILSEVCRLRNYEHQNIITIFGVALLPSAENYILEIYSEKCSTNLSTLIFNNKEPWSSTKTYLAQTLEGLAFLHERGFVHGNLQPSNILVKRDTAKLGDVGVSLSHGNIKSFYGKETDILRFGIIVWESWYRRSCIDDLEDTNSYDDIERSIDKKNMPEFDADIPRKLKTIIIECWDENPEKRPSASAIIIR